MTTIIETENINKTDELSVKRKSAFKGAFFSMYIDMFDIYLPVVIMAPVMFYFQPLGLTTETQVILTSLVFITTLLGRPLGAIIFGMLADKLGRRLATIYSVSGFAITTFLIGVLPGYPVWGLTAYILLVLLRFINGIFLGGGYTGSVPLAFEYAKKEHRGLWGGVILSAFPAAYVTINLLGILMLTLFPLGGVDSAYVKWGWRIPFFIGGILSALLSLYYFFKVSESEVWEKSKKAKTTENTQESNAHNDTENHAPSQKLPIINLLKGDSGKNLLQVLLLMTGFWTTQNLITLYLPLGLLVNVLKLSGIDMIIVLLIAYLTLILSYILAGILSQKIGRRRYFMLSTITIITLGSYILHLLNKVESNFSYIQIIFLVTILCVIVTSPWGVILTYINERFATGVRATGFGIGYSLSVIVPSFYAFYIGWLNHLSTPQLAPVILLIIGGSIGFLGAYLGPETKNVDFESGGKNDT